MPLIGPVFLTPSTCVNGIISFAEEDSKGVKNSVSDANVMRPDAFLYWAGNARHLVNQGTVKRQSRYSLYVCRRGSMLPVGKATLGDSGFSASQFSGRFHCTDGVMSTY